MMNHSNTILQKDLEKYLRVVRLRLETQAKKHGLKVLVLATLAYIVFQKDLTIDLYLNGAQPSAAVALDEPAAPEVTSEAAPVNVSLFEKGEKPAPTSRKKTKKDDNLANTYSNMTYTEKKFATNESSEARVAKRRKQEAYVKRFAKVAQTEMEKFGIPASIVLAQGLLESDAGDSKLAVKNRNHFGVKCFSRSCRKGHCSNFTDDSHKDFFRIYESPWESYRAHSHLLAAPRYKHLYKLGRTDYRAWAMGLKRAGYATDKFYGEKLINLIDELNLHQYDY
ncbi:MAG: glucosaminidase domain-containing protein [Saprospiraceae bacterium]